MEKGLIQFKDAALRDVSLPDTQKALKAVLLIEAPLSHEQAGKLKCGHMFKRNGDPIDAAGKYSPQVKLTDVEFQLPSGTNDGFDTYRPELIRGFVVTPKDDLHLLVQFRVHITGIERGQDVYYSRVKLLGKKFECAIRSLQEEFNFTGEPSGTRSGEEEEPEENPATPGLFAVPDEPAEASSGPAIADAAAMQGRKKPKGKTRQPAATEAEVEESVTVQ